MAQAAAVSIGGGRIGRVEIEIGSALAVVALAGVVFVPTLGTAGALLFLASGCALCAFRPARLAARARRDWPAIALAVFCVLSTTWSREPVLSLRFGVQLAATIVIALAIADRLSPRTFCLAMAGFLGIGMVASVLGGSVGGDTMAWTGIYGSKNAFGGAAATFTIFAAGLAAARSASALRMAFALASVGGFALVVLAQSLGALVFLTLTLSATFGLVAARRLGRVPAAAILAFFAMGLVLAALVASAHAPELKELFLDATGKDITLTGRTELWRVAAALISERPLLGVGFQAFWVQGNASAEALWHLFGIESRSGFNFHNMYLSNAVEIGLLGVALQAFVLLGTLSLALRWTWTTGSPVAAVFLALTLMVVMGSFIEVPLFFQFSLRTVLVVAAFAYARDALARSV